MTTLDAIADLTLAQCCERWGVASRNSIKARAAALGVELIRESSTRTIWPAAYVALGDELADHLTGKRATLANFPGSVMASGDGSDGGEGLSVMAPTAGSHKRNGKLSAVMAASDGSDTITALAALAAALQQKPTPDPLVVARGLAEAADLGAWLTTAELAALLGVAAGTPRGWESGHSPRPGFELERRKDGASVWWLVTRQ